MTKRLAFGSTLTTWAHVRQLHEMGFTHVVNLRYSRRHKKKLRGFRSLWLPFHDDKTPRPTWFYRRALRFYKHAMRQRKAKVLVMCHHGMCRSASLTYFFLRASGRGPRKAEALVRRARPCAIVARAYRESGEEFLQRRARWLS